MLAAFVEPSSALLEGVFGHPSCRRAQRRIGGGRFQRCEQRAHGEQQTLQSRRRGGGAGLDKMRVCAAGDATAHDANIASRLRMLKRAAPSEVENHWRSLMMGAIVCAPIKLPTRRNSERKRRTPTRA